MAWHLRTLPVHFFLVLIFPPAPMNSRVFPRLSAMRFAMRSPVLDVRPVRYCLLAASVVLLLSVFGDVPVMAQSPASPLEQTSVILYERAGKRCAEVSWQCLPHSNSRLTWYLQEMPSGEPYTCLIARGLDSTKSYELLFQPAFPLYHFAGSASHRINPHALPVMHDDFSPDSPKWYGTVLFCREDAEYMPSIFPERGIPSDAFYVALLYVSRKEKHSEYTKKYHIAAKRSKATYLAKPHPRLTAMDTLVSPATATSLRPFDMVRTAQEYERGQNFEEAITRYSAALRSCPRYQNAYYERGHLYLHLDSARKALEDFNHALALDSSDYRAWGNRASALYQCGLYSEAITSAERAVYLKPEQTGASLFRALSFEALADTVNASRAALQLVRTLIETNDSQTAIAEEALSLANRMTNDAAWREYFRVEAERSAENEKYHQAIEYWNYLLRREPGNVHALYRRCYHASYVDILVHDALAYSDSLFAYAPNADSAYFVRGLLLHNHKSYDQAKQAFTSAITLRPNYAYAYFRRSMSRYYLKETPDSVQKDIRQALHHAPQDNWLWYQAAKYFSITNHPDSTVLYASKAIEFDSMYYSAYKIRAEAFDELQNPSAIADYSRCIQLAETIENAEKEFAESLAELYRERGRVKSNSNDSTAAQDFKTSIRLFPSATGFGYRADWHYRHGFYLEAITDFDSVLAHNPSSDYALYIKADCLYRLKEYWASLSLLNRLATENKYHKADVYYLRAYVNSSLDDDEEFCHDLQRAANAGSKEAEADLVKYCMGEENEDG